MALAKGKLAEEFIARLRVQFGSRADAILRAFGSQKPVSMRVNTLKSDDAAVMDFLRDEGVRFERVRGVPHAFFLFGVSEKTVLGWDITQQGRIYLQGVSSMLPPLVLQPKPGDRVLDLCAAPGSKTTQIAAMMENRGMIMALEENEIRYQKLLNTISTQGATVAIAKHQDANRFESESFDKILADVPCSAEGRICLQDARSHGFWAPGNAAKMAKAQRRLLKTAVRLLKPNGLLVYSTCTLAPEENEDMAAWLLAEHPDLRPIDFDLPVAGIRHEKGGLTVLPTERLEGFFVAAFRKTA